MVDAGALTGDIASAATVLAKGWPATEVDTLAGDMTGVTAILAGASRRRTRALSQGT